MLVYHNKGMNWLFTRNSHFLEGKISGITRSFLPVRHFDFLCPAAISLAGTAIHSRNATMHFSLRIFSNLRFLLTPAGIA